MGGGRGNNNSGVTHPCPCLPELFLIFSLRCAHVFYSKCVLCLNCAFVRVRVHTHARTPIFFVFVHATRGLHAFLFDFVGMIQHTGETERGGMTRKARK